jgi:hypothetical protein
MLIKPANVKRFIPQSLEAIKFRGDRRKSEEG